MRILLTCALCLFFSWKLGEGIRHQLAVVAVPVKSNVVVVNGISRGHSAQGPILHIDRRYPARAPRKADWIADISCFLLSTALFGLALAKRERNFTSAGANP